MPAGLGVTTIDGYIQVDDRYKNLALILKTSAVTTTAGQSGSANKGSYCEVSCPIGDILAFRAVFNVALDFVTVSGSVKTFRLRAPDNPAGSPIEIFQFGPPPSSATGDFGLEVFNEFGEIGFSSAFSYMRAASSIVSDQYLTAVGQYDLPAGKMYAAAVSMPAGYFEQYVDDTVGSFFVITLTRDLASVRFNSTGYAVSVRPSYFLTYNSSSPPVDYSQSQDRLDILIIDVTGL